MTWVMIQYMEAAWFRDVQEEPYPDAIMELNGERFYWEMDTGSMSIPRMRSRFEHYRSYPDQVLVVCLSDIRIRNLMPLTKGMNVKLTTLDRIMGEDETEWFQYSGK